MNNKMAFKFAFKNMRANSLLLTPFLIASSIMSALFFIMSSLGQNKYVEENFEYILMLIRFGNILAGIFTFIFILYANGFLTKRRNKEFALYGILGLEKKHIAKIVFIEYILNFFVISIFSVIGGFVLGKLSLVILNRVTKNITAKVIDYGFSTPSAILTFAFLGITFIFIYLLTIFKIEKSTPIELLSSQKKAEGEPKSKFILGTLGFIILCYGYYISITSEERLESFYKFFPAVILVIFGTYLLFIAFSILILKLLKRNRNLYYKAKNFLSISGMLYRMKSNAVSLASIALLATSIIVTLSSTLTINSGIKEVAKSIDPQDFFVEFLIDDYRDKDWIEIGNRKKREVTEFLNTILKNDEKIKDLKIYKHIFLQPVLNENGKLVPLGKKRAVAKYLFVEILDEYNEKNNTNYTLKDDEVLYSSNLKSLYKPDNLELAGQNYKLVKISDEIPKHIAGDSIKIIVKDDETFAKMGKAYEKGAGYFYYLRFSFDTENVKDKGEFFERLQNNFNYRDTDKKDGMRIYFSSKERNKKIMYEVNGGFLFLGAIISLIFITGTILITYYKQISEGFEDRQNYQIMKNVGLPDKMIKKSLRTQILWIFFLPLIVAMTHSAFAFPILYNMLRGLGLNNSKLFAMNFGVVVLAFTVLYFIIYTITSRIYYKIVK